MRQHVFLPSSCPTLQGQPGPNHLKMPGASSATRPGRSSAGFVLQLEKCAIVGIFQHHVFHKVQNITAKHSPIPSANHHCCATRFHWTNCSRHGSPSFASPSNPCSCSKRTSCPDNSPTPHADQPSPSRHGVPHASGSTSKVQLPQHGCLPAVPAWLFASQQPCSQGWSQGWPQGSQVVVAEAAAKCLGPGPQF